jgi:hypothetical protein
LFRAATCVPGGASRSPRERNSLAAATEGELYGTERPTRAAAMLKVLAWIVGIIFLIGLLVVFGVFDLIF